MTIPGSSRTFASSERDRERLKRRLWLAALCLYAAMGLVDLGWHARQDAQAGENWLAPDNISVSFAAGLFWPADLVAGVLLAG